MKSDTTQDKIIFINNIFKKYDSKLIAYQICEICLEPKNLIICDICKNYYHTNCLEIKEIPVKFLCHNCKEFNNTGIKQSAACIYDSKIIKYETEVNLSSGNFKETRKLKKDINNMIAESLNESTKTFNTQIKGKDEEINKRIIKHRKKRINNLDDSTRIEKSDRKDLLSFDNSETHYRKRKIKIGDNHNLSMDEYYNKIENEMNPDEVDYERHEMKKIWSHEENPLNDEQLDNYLKTARIFWDYRNLNIENELCADFFIDLEEYIKDNKINFFNKGHIISDKVELLKKFLKRGVNLTTHFDEMALKILHICHYKQKVALLFLLKGFNPFIEEIEENFKSDVHYFQKEILSILSDDEV